jgi:type IV secretion system protein VirB9
VLSKIPISLLLVVLALVGSSTIGEITVDAQTSNSSAAPAMPSSNGGPANASTGTVDPAKPGDSPSAAQQGTAGTGRTPPHSETRSPAVAHRDPRPAERHGSQAVAERKNKVMPKTGESALKASGAWNATVNPAALGSDGRVVFTYGSGMPVVVCAPLRVCVIQLEHGEHVVSPPYIGDSVRWDVSMESSGNEGQETPLIIVKPRDVSLDTSLFLATDRRTYYIRLMSKPGSYTPMVAFEYPEENEAKMRTIVRQEQARKLAEISAASKPESIFYSYEIKGHGSFKPIRVMDDGTKTYIQMSPENLHRELPTLVIQGPGGKELVNFRVRDNYFIVDRLFDRAELLLGSGKHTQKVEIIRQGKLAHMPPTLYPLPKDVTPEGSN